MKTTIQFLIVSVLSILIGTNLQGQAQVSMSSGVSAPDDVDVDAVQKAVQDAITEYEEYATLSDPNEGGDLTSRIERGFYKLFTDQGLSDVLQDFYFELTPEDRGSTEDYFDFIRLTGMRELSFYFAGA